MARSISINDLTFAQVSLGTDSLVVEYCDSKSDQKGERASPKNGYANPVDYNFCILLLLDVIFVSMMKVGNHRKINYLGIGTPSREV